MSRKTRELTLIGILAVAVAGSTLALMQRTGDYQFFDPLIDIKAILDHEYVTPIADDDLQQAAIRGMLESLNDPHTMYVPPASSGEFNKLLSGEYVGIGAEVTVRDGWLTIVNPMEDSPALAAGLRPDDKVVAIEGESTENKDIEDSIDLLQGEPGTPVKITIERDGVKKDVVIRREHIKTREVKGFHRDPAADAAWKYLIDPANNIAYVRVAQFTDKVADEVENALRHVQDQAGHEPAGIILDLRDNPGGRLDEAAQLADLFLSDGVIVSTKGLHHAESVMKASRGQPFENVPMMVLISGQSASASEIVSGALKDNHRALIVGTRSFGKGSVQTVRPLPSQPGAMLKVTEQFYYLPSGRCINRTEDSTEWGVDPSPGYFVPMTEQARFDMLKARREQEIIRLGQNGAGDHDGHWSDPAWIVQTLKDPQLGKALTALQTRVQTGDWPQVDQTQDVAQAAVSRELGQLQVQYTRLAREIDRIAGRIDTLESGSDVEAANPRDLIPDDARLAGGEMTIRDADGNIIATLKITGDDLEKWLIDADVEPESTAPESN